MVGEEHYSSERVTGGREDKALRRGRMEGAGLKGKTLPLLSATNKPFPRVTESHSTGGTRDHGFPLKRTKALPFRGTPHGLEWHFPQCVPLGANRC